MTIETVGSFLPNEKLIKARQEYNSGLIDRNRLSEIEDEAVTDIVDRQIACGLQYITSGEIRRKHWAYDFWFGLEGISCERIDSGHIYQSIETATDHVHITRRIGFNPQHPFLSDFTFLFNSAAGRARCRQTLPSPANLFLEIYCLYNGHPEHIYPSVDLLISDIAETYRRTLLQLYESGCRSIQFDDTACGLMCDDNFTKRLLQGGVDLLNLHKQIITVINTSITGLPDDMETSVYMSGGDIVVPEWEYIRYPDNIMPTALSSLNVDKFFLPFNMDDEYSIEVLRHIPKGKKVVLGLADAHSPFSEDITMISATVARASGHIPVDNISVSPKTGFKLSSYASRGLTYEDQWAKIYQLQNIGCQNILNRFIK